MAKIEIKRVSKVKKEIREGGGKDWIKRASGEVRKRKRREGGMTKTEIKRVGKGTKEER